MRLIDADALCEKIAEWQTSANYNEVAKVIRTIVDTPTIDIEERLNDAYEHGWSDAEAKYHDAVEVVRCKDCVHRNDESWCRLMGEYMPNNGFCSRGGQKR